MGCDFPFGQDVSHPYGSSVSSASSSTSSVFSFDAASSHSSISSAATSIHGSWDSTDSWTRPQTSFPDATCAQPESFATSGNISRFNTACQNQGALPPLRSAVDAALAADSRRNPRRCSSINTRAPPTLVRQSERTVKFVDSLVDSATQMVEIIWPLSVPTCPGSGRGVLPLRTFIQETLRRSRTSYSTLQVALYYLILIKAHVPRIDFTMEQPEDQSLRALQCGRRMFLAALILASKYLQDRNYSARAWSKISGLKVHEINTNEMAFLKAVNWKLHITDPVFERWQAIVLRASPSHPPPSPGVPQLPCGYNDWKTLIPILTPDLDNFDLTRKSPTSMPVSGQLSPPAPFAPSFARDAWQADPSSAPRQKATPYVMEPTVDITPPAPLLSRLGPLPTPQMTPQSAASNTPAASIAAAGARRPSMCTAMAYHQNTMSRSALDQVVPAPRYPGLEAYQVCGRRPSLATSTTSSSSSPESMISDSSSRSSRASSISSVSSAAWAPDTARLAKLATCRNAGLPYQVQPKEKEGAEYVPSMLPSEPLSSPDLEGFHINDASEPTPVPFQRAELPSSNPEDGVKGRKRCRSSTTDTSLQQNVRALLTQDQLAAQTLLAMETDRQRGGLQRPSLPPSVLSDPCIATSFLLDDDTTSTPTPTMASMLCAKGLQSPLFASQVPATTAPRRRPVQKHLGRKRACCASEVSQLLQQRSAGPGMWDGII